MRSVQISLLILFSSVVVSLVSGCKKNDNPVGPSLIEPDKAVYFVSPKPRSDWLSGSSQEIKWAIHKDSIVKKVVIEISDGSSYKPFFEANADSLSRQFIVHLMTDKYYFFRIRDINRQIWDTSSRVYVYGNYGRILYPTEGDEIHRGSNSYIKYECSKFDAVYFDLSTNDGTDWHPLTYSRTTDSTTKWFVNYDPSESCRMRMRTHDSTILFISGKFRIISDLVEFFPLKVGNTFIYQREFYQIYENRETKEKDSVRIEVINSNISNDTIFYNCKVTKTQNNPDSSIVTTGEIKEINSGLHLINSKIEPLRGIQIYRYLDRTVNSMSDSFYGGISRHWWYYELTKGYGLTKYYYGTELGGGPDHNDTKWTLQH